MAEQNVKNSSATDFGNSMKGLVSQGTVHYEIPTATTINRADWITLTPVGKLTGPPRWLKPLTDGVVTITDFYGTAIAYPAIAGVNIEFADAEIITTDSTCTIAAQW